jgi:hypothetical protein
MTETYEFSQMEIEDLLHNHEYEIEAMLNQMYNDISKELKEDDDNE